MDYTYDKNSLFYVYSIYSKWMKNRDPGDRSRALTLSSGLYELYDELYDLSKIM